MGTCTPGHEFKYSWSRTEPSCCTCQCGGENHGKSYQQQLKFNFAAKVYNTVHDDKICEICGQPVDLEGIEAAGTNYCSNCYLVMRKMQKGS